MRIRAVKPDRIHPQGHNPSAPTRGAVGVGVRRAEGLGPVGPRRKPDIHRPACRRRLGADAPGWGLGGGLRGGWMSGNHH
jgi:hypothetical protein